MLRPRSLWTWALVAALLTPAQSCLLDSGPFAAADPTGSGGAGGSGAATTTGDSTASGGGSVCGNGEKEDGEACDDGNATEGDGCFECRADCGCPDCVAGEPCAGCEEIKGAVLLKDPASKRCYLFIPAKRAPTDARDACVDWGGDLVAPSTQAEMDLLVDPDFVAAFVAGADPSLVWTGGRHDGTWKWQNGEPWKLPPDGPAWQGGNPNPASGTDCAAMDADGKILDRFCSDGLPFMCERAPM